MTTKDHALGHTWSITWSIVGLYIIYLIFRWLINHCSSSLIIQVRKKWHNIYLHAQESSFAQQLTLLETKSYRHAYVMVE